MVIDKTFHLCPSSPCCSVAAFSLPSFYQGQGTGELLDGENSSSGWERRIPCSCSISHGIPGSSSSALLWQIHVVEVFCGGILWDGL